MSQHHSTSANTDAANAKSYSNILNLTARQTSRFRHMVKLYEQKQYKRALRETESILKSNANHAETISMKGLILLFMNRESEGEELIMKGLKLNIRSHVCWHVCGLFHRNNHDYEKAVKCYINALRIDKDNFQIMKDLSLLQLQIRDLNGFYDIRHKMLVQQSSNKNNQISYAIACFFAHHYSKCIHVIEAYEKTVDSSSNDSVEASQSYELSELLLFKVCVQLCEYKESIRSDKSENKLQSIYDSLIQNYSKIVDSFEYHRIKANILIELNRLDEATQIYENLIELNTEDRSLILAFFQCKLMQRNLSIEMDASRYMKKNEKELDWKRVPEFGNSIQQKNFIQTLMNKSLGFDKARSLVCETLEELCMKYSRSNTCLRLQLEIFENQENQTLKLRIYIRNALKRNVPSLFRDLHSLVDGFVCEEVVSKFVSELGGSDGLDLEDPALLTSILYYEAQYYDCFGEFKKALEKINRAIELTPTMIDLYLQKARIFKHAGDFIGAFEQADKARLMDTADRYLNVKSVRYAFRANRIKDAESRVRLFLRESDTLKYMHEMQCFWWELAAGRNLINQQKFGEALYKFYEVDKHFIDIFEDQFDFHTYCIRKMTLTSYSSMIDFGDKLNSHRYFIEAAKSIVSIYLALENRQKSDKDNMLLLSKDKAGKKREVQSKNSSSAKNNSSAFNTQSKVVIPSPQNLVSVDDYIEPATKFVKLLQKHCEVDSFSASSEKFIDVWLLACELQLMKGKYLLALRALYKAIHAALAHDTYGFDLKASDFVNKLRNLFALPSNNKSGYKATGTRSSDCLWRRLQNLLVVSVKVLCLVQSNMDNMDESIRASIIKISKNILPCIQTIFAELRQSFNELNFRMQLAVVYSNYLVSKLLKTTSAQGDNELEQFERLRIENPEQFEEKLVCSVAKNAAKCYEQCVEAHKFLLHKAKLKSSNSSLADRLYEEAKTRFSYAQYFNPKNNEKADKECLQVLSYQFHVFADFV